MSAPKITKEQILAAIEKVEYEVLKDQKTTICSLYFYNGRFTVRGESSCVAKENFNAELGQKIAYENALDKCWQLFGFQLAAQLALVDESKAAVKHIHSKVYIGTKVVFATPMSRADYNELRGWELPAGENGADEGYLVEYGDKVNVPNVIGYAGYISWSPKTVFEDSYKELGVTPKASTFITRLEAEHDELKDKYIKLEKFLVSNAFQDLEPRMKKLMRRQALAMHDYVWILSERLKMLKAQD